MGVIADGVNKYITTPVSLVDVADVLGTPYDVGAVCTADSVNIWAKFTPVCLTDMFTPDEIADGYWSGKVYPSTGKPWYYGTGGAEKFNVPKLTSIEDIKAGAAWSRRKPNGSVYPYRLTDFLGYNHLAKCPLRSYLPNAIYTNTDNVLGIESITDTGVFGFTAQEVLDLFPITQAAGTAPDIYLGMVLGDGVNYSVLSKDTPIDFKDTTTRQFNIVCSKATDGYYLSVANSDGSSLGMFADIGDNIEVMLFLADTPSMTEFGYASELKFSALFDASSKVYALTTLTYIQLTYNASIEEETPIFTGMEYLDTDKYIRQGNTIALVSSYITGFSQGAVKIKATDVNSIKYRSLYVRLYQRLSLTNEGEDYTSEDWADALDIVTRGGGTLTATGTNYTFPEQVDYSFEVYDTEEDARMGVNYEVVQGYPIIDQIIVNEDNPNAVGWCSNELAVRGVITPETEHTTIKVNGEITL